MSYPTENQRAWTEFEEKRCDPKGMWGLLVWCEHEDKKHRHLPLALPSPCVLQTSKQRIKGKRIIGGICYLGRRIDVYIFGRRLGNIFPINKLFPYYVFPTLLAPTSAGRMYNCWNYQTFHLAFKKLHFGIRHIGTRAATINGFTYQQEINLKQF